MLSVHISADPDPDEPEIVNMDSDRSSFSSLRFLATLIPGGSKGWKHFYLLSFPSHVIYCSPLIF